MPWIDDVGYVEDEIPKPASYEEQVAYARQIGVPENEIAGNVGTPQSVAANAQIQAQNIYEITGQAPSWAQDVGYTPPPPAWLNPQDYISEGFAAPYTRAEITGQVDPSNFRTMNGQLYASAKGASDLSGGEYLIDPNTGRFALDASGNPIGVRYPAPSGFQDFITTPRGALTTGAAIMGALYGGTALLGANAGAGAAGAGALETSGAYGLTGGGAFVPAAGSGASFTIAPGAAYTAAGLGNSGLFSGTNLGTTGMGDLNIGDVEAQLGGYYGGEAPVNPYTNMTDAQIAAELANTPSFITSGGDYAAATDLLKQYGAPVVKALLGGGGTAAQRAALGLGQTGLGSLFGGGTGLYLSGQNQQALQNVYNAQAQKVSNAATQAQNLAAFTPIGTTNFFGSSQFTRDPITGQLTSAGFTPTAQVGGQIQNLFGLGAQALPTTANTQDIQRQYIAQQQGLLAPGREQALAQLNNTQFQTGRTGLATGGTTAGYAPGQAGLMQTNPQLAAYYNSLAQQDAQLAANAPTYAQSLLDKQIATGTGLFGSANTLQGYAQQPLTTSIDLAKAQAAAGANAGQLGLTGQTNAAQLAATGSLQGNAAMQGTYNQLGQVATGIGNQLGGMLLQNPTIANWLS
jgi:hypothetical protein